MVGRGSWVGLGWWVGLVACLSIFVLPGESSAQFFGRFRGPFGGPIGPPLPLPIGPPIGFVPAVPVAPGVVSTPYGLTSTAPVVALPPVRSVHYGSGYFGGYYGADVRVGGNGSVSVRTPGFSFDSFVAEAPIAPVAPVGYVEPSVDEAIGSLQYALADLSRSLESHRDGETWIDYIQPEVLALALEGWAASRSYASADQLRAASTPLEGIAANPQLAWISSMPGFEAVLNGVRSILGDAVDTSDSGAMSRLPESSVLATPLAPNSATLPPTSVVPPAIDAPRSTGSPTLAPAPETANPAAGQPSQPESLPAPSPQDGLDA